jgi:beta-glucuronidase
MEITGANAIGPAVTTGTTLLTNLRSRRAAGQVTSLDGTWRAIIDPYDTGYVNILGERNTQGFFRDFKPRHAGDRVEYDFDTSLELAVPGDWNTQHPELHFYEGTIWYRRLFAVDRPGAEGTRSYLSFGAVNHTSRVFLDGEELATHVGGFGGFAVEVTGKLAVGTHSLVVMVDNRREPDRIPAMRTDWWNFGGITRSVELVTVPATFVRDAWVTMAPDGSIVGGMSVDGNVEGLTVRVEIGSTTVEDGHPAQAEGTYTFVGAEGDLELERWNPGVPVLHSVSFGLIDADGNDVDRITDQVGFRTVRTQGTDIVVNDEPVFCKGISIHGEGPSGGKRAHGADDAATLLGWAVELGANFVRLGHYQHDEAMVHEADRLGLMVWGELPVYWGIDFGNDVVLANGLEQADELVVRDRSRASVILWSAANETLPGEDRNRFIAALLERFREVDPTRLVTAALLTLPSNDPDVHIDDPLGEHVDVIGVNQYLGWYYGNRDDIPSVRWTSAFGKPLIFSELGAGAKFGRHGEEGEIWTEEFQAALYDAQIEMIRSQTECAGMSPWILKDFRTPMRVLPGIQDGYNRKGLVSEEGEKKLAFDTLRTFYNSLD